MVCYLRKVHLKAGVYDAHLTVQNQVVVKSKLQAMTEYVFVIITIVNVTGTGQFFPDWCWFRMMWWICLVSVCFVLPHVCSHCVCVHADAYIRQRSPDLKEQAYRLERQEYILGSSIVGYPDQRENPAHMHCTCFSQFSIFISLILGKGSEYSSCKNGWGVPHLSSQSKQHLGK